MFLKKNAKFHFQNKHLQEHISDLESSLKLMKTLSQPDDISSQISAKKVFLPQTTHSMTLCLDLDETLIHTDFTRQYMTHDYLYEGQLGVNFRPGVKQFLSFASKHFEVVLFTKSIKEYADKVIKLLDPDGQIFTHRFYRDDCITMSKSLRIKDLRILANRSTDKIILIDDNIINMCNQLGNGYLIPSFFNDSSDKELSKLQEFLSEGNLTNIKEALRSRFGFEEKLICA